jgi:hypothetical protein
MTPIATAILAPEYLRNVSYLHRFHGLSEPQPVAHEPSASPLSSAPAAFHKPSESYGHVFRDATSTQQARLQFDKRFSSRSERSHQEARSALGTTGTQNAQ